MVGFARCGLLLLPRLELRRPIEMVPPRISPSTKTLSFTSKFLPPLSAYSTLPERAARRKRPSQSYRDPPPVSLARIAFILGFGFTLDPFCIHFGFTLPECVVRRNSNSIQIHFGFAVRNHFM